MIPSLAVLAAVLAAASAPPPDAAPPTPTPAASHEAEGVEVTARPPPVVGDLQKGVLNYKPDFFTPVRPGTALDMVNWLPGFTFEDTRDMRGLEGSTGNVLIDGKPPTSKTDTLYSVLRRIPADQVERIDIIVGGAPGIDMHGRALIANVILKASATVQRLISLSNTLDIRGRAGPDLLMTSSQKYAGKVLEASLEVGRNLGVGPNFGYGSWVRRDGTGATLFTTDMHDNISSLAGVGSVAYETPFAGGALKFNILGRYYLSLYDEKDPLKPPPGLYSFHERDIYKQAELGVHYQRSFGRATFETQLLERPTTYDTHQDTRRPPSPTTYFELGNQSETALRSVLKFKKDDTLNMEGFAEAALNGFDSQVATTTNGVPQVLPVANVRVTEQRGEAGGTLAWKPNARFGLDTTLKFEAADLTARGDETLEHSLFYVKPRLVLSWAPDKNNQLRLRVEHEVGQINFGNFITYTEYNSGNVRLGAADLRPARDWVVEAVAERHFWDGGDVSLTVRRLALEDVVDVAPVTTPQGVFGQTTNIGNGSQTDLVADVTFPLKHFGLDGVMVKGKVSYSRPQVPDPVSGRDRLLSGRSELTGELHFAQDFPKWKVNWGVDAFYTGGFALYRPLGNEVIGAWTHVNVFIEHRLDPKLVFRAEIDNLPADRVRQTFSVFSGLRDHSPLTYVDEKRTTAGPMLMLRIRRSFE